MHTHTIPQYKNEGNAISPSPFMFLTPHYFLYIFLTVLIFTFEKRSFSVIEWELFCIHNNNAFLWSCWYLQVHCSCQLVYFLFMSSCLLYIFKCISALRCVPLRYHFLVYIHSYICMYICVSLLFCCDSKVCFIFSLISKPKSAQLHITSVIHAIVLSRTETLTHSVTLRFCDSASEQVLNLIKVKVAKTFSQLIML